MDDLQQFRGSYLEECQELLTEMEEHLLGLSSDNADSETLNAIFRCAHSIKGGAGTFGFTRIQQFTHVLEALLDEVRQGNIALSSELIDILLKSRDVVLHMVVTCQADQEVPADYGQDIEKQLEAFISKEITQASVASSDAGKEEKDTGVKTYTIHFTPDKELMLHGNEPLYLLRELETLGECTISCSNKKLPLLDKLDASACYLDWQIVLTTAESKERIQEVFEFVEDECKLTIEEKKTIPEVETVVENKAAPLSEEPAKQQVSAIRVDIEKVDRLINMVGEIVITQAVLQMQSDRLPPKEYNALIQGISELTQHTRELQEAVMAVRMQPVRSIFARMPRLVRDLSQQLGKKVTLEMRGEQTEVDKTIIEQLSDPLNHMFRNSLDHGLETPEERLKAGKLEEGTIILSASHGGGKIIIEISDDGKGINRERVLAKAIEKNVVSSEANLSDTDIDQLIFAPGFSTAEAVTSVSGRGVGMDVVKRNIENIGGSVVVENDPGKGAKFLIMLPLTLAILEGMVVRVSDEYYIVPIVNILESLRPEPKQLEKLPNGTYVINIRDTIMPLLKLEDIFSICRPTEKNTPDMVVLVENGPIRFGLIVDELIGQQQVVIKSLEENADPIPGIAGATILGNGMVSLILDIVGLSRLTPRPTKKSAQYESFAA